MSLFQLQKNKTNHNFKINCDTFTDEDWECIAFLLSKKLPNFKKAISTPKSGKTLAEKMQKYTTEKDSLPILICDDVLTTNLSIERFRDALQTTDTYGGVNYSKDKIIAAVVFSTGKCPHWVTPLIKM